MKKILILVLWMFLLFSCGEDKVEEKTIDIKKIKNNKINEICTNNKDCDKFLCPVQKPSLKGYCTELKCECKCDGWTCR